MARKRKNSVTLKKYVDTRFAAQDKATALALETVKVAMEKDDRRLSSWLSIAAIVVSVAIAVYTLARHL